MDTKESSWFQFEFWVSLGAVVLCLAAFQVLVSTSIPVYNTIMEAFGISLDLAPPTDPVLFYTKFQAWFAVAILVLTGAGQAFYLFKIKNRYDVETKLALPFSLAIVSTAAVIFLGKFTSAIAMALVFSSVVAITFSGLVLLRNQKVGAVHIGGSLSHIGFAIMMLGFLYSSDKSRIVSQNESLDFAKNTVREESRKSNVLLVRNEPSLMNGYLAHYLGPQLLTDAYGYVDHDDLLMTTDEKIFVVGSSIISSNGSKLNKGDTIYGRPENRYYKIMMVSQSGESFTIYPRMQNNEEMGYMASPGITKFWNRDLYAHISNFPDEKKLEWSDPVDMILARNDTTFLESLAIVFRGITREEQSIGFSLGKNDVLLKPRFDIYHNGHKYEMNPLVASLGGALRLYPDHNKPLGVKLWVTQIGGDNKRVAFKVSTSQKDWITLKAIEFPHINLVWLGTIVMSLGVGLSVSKRFMRLGNRKKREAIDLLDGELVAEGMWVTHKTRVQRAQA